MTSLPERIVVETTVNQPAADNLELPLRKPPQRPGRKGFSSQGHRHEDADLMAAD